MPAWEEILQGKKKRMSGRLSTAGDKSKKSRLVLSTEVYLV
jgi:hypothetical protein